MIKTVVIGAGFGGLHLINHLSKDKSQQIILVDRHDYNFFPPLIYQVAAGFLAPSDISYPIRKYLTKKPNIRYRQGTFKAIDTQRKVVVLDNGEVEYDRLILALGAEPNFFGNENIEKFAFPMKRLSEALTIRNRLLEQFNYATTLPENEREPYLRIVIAGGGPSGVELAGVLAEIRSDIFAHEYPELLESNTSIELITADDSLLVPMSKNSQDYAQKQLEKYGVVITFSDPVKDYDGSTVTLFSGKTMRAKTLIWTAGVKCHRIEGLNDDDVTHGNRLVVNDKLQLVNHPDIYALGDIAICHTDDNYPKGHPQLGQVAMSQGKFLGKNLARESQQSYRYQHRGDMAMVGRLKAVAEIKKLNFNGFLAWITWVWIHIIALATNKNRIATTYNWMIAFFTRNQSMRMEIKAQPVKEQEKKQEQEKEQDARDDCNNNRS